MGRRKGSKNRIRKVPLTKIERVDSEEMPGDESTLMIKSEFHEEDEMQDETLPIFDDNVLRSYKVGNYEKCIELIDRILLNNSDENKDHYKILSAASYTMSGQSFEEAHSLLDDVLRSNPLSSYAMYGKGVAFFFEKKLNDSIEWLDKAIAASPGPEMDRARDMRVRADLERRTAIIVIRKMPQNEHIFDADGDDDDDIDMLDDINLDFKELNDIKIDYIDMDDGDSQFAMVRRCSSPKPVEEIGVEEAAEAARANTEVAENVPEEELRNEAPEEATQPCILAEEKLIENVEELKEVEILAPSLFAPKLAPKPQKPVTRRSFQANAADEDNLQKTESHKRQKTEHKPEVVTSHPEVIAPTPVAPKPAAKSPKPVRRRSLQASAADGDKHQKMESNQPEAATFKPEIVAPAPDDLESAAKPPKPMTRRSLQASASDGLQKTELKPEVVTFQPEVIAPPPVAPKPAVKSPKPVRRRSLQANAAGGDKHQKMESNQPEVVTLQPELIAPAPDDLEPAAKSPKPVRRDKFNTSPSIEEKSQEIENTNEPEVASKDSEVKAPLSAVNARPVTAEEFFASGMEFYMSGNLKRSLKQFEKAINLDPTMTKADDAGAKAQELLEMMDVATLNMNQKNYEIVVQIVNDALEVDPTNLFINRPLYYQRGLANLYLGNTEASMKDYAEFERLNKILLEK